MSTAKTVWLRWAQSVLAGHEQHPPEFSPTRRNFIKNTAKSAIGLAFLPTVDGPMFGKKSPKIAIIGGGLAGMTCAWRLKNAGLKPMVFEASERTGGRTMTLQGFQKRGKTCELGGEYFTSDHHHLIRLARDLRKRIYTCSQPNRGVKPFKAFFGGEEVQLQDLENSLSAFYDSIIEDVDLLPEYATWENAASFGQLDQLSIKEYLTAKKADPITQQFLKRAFLIENGMEVDEQSAINLLEMFKGGFIYHPTSKIRSLQIKGGNQTLCDDMAKDLWKTIFTNHKLVELHQRTDGYKLRFQNGKRTKTVEADYVVVAIPFRTFKNIETNVAFNNRKQQAINELGYGNKSMLLMGFNQKAWKDQGYAGLTFSDEKFGYGNDLAPKQKGEDQVLSIKPAGKEAEEFDRMDTFTAAMKCLHSLDKIYPGISNHFDGQVVKFSWSSNSNFLGSNSCYKVGQRTAFGGEEGKAVGDLFFAGEHCSPNFKGTMNGAVESGTLAAATIARRIERRDGNRKGKFRP